MGAESTSGVLVHGCQKAMSISAHVIILCIYMYTFTLMY